MSVLIFYSSFLVSFCIREKMKLVAYISKTIVVRLLGGHYTFFLNAFCDFNKSDFFIAFFFFTKCHFCLLLFV